MEKRIDFLIIDQSNEAASAEQRLPVDEDEEFLQTVLLVPPKSRGSGRKFQFKIYIYIYMLTPMDYLDFDL